MVKAKRKKLVKPKAKRHNAVTLSKLTFHKLDWLEWVTIGFAALFFIYPEPYDTLLGILLVIPILGMLINGLDRPSMATLVQVSAGKNGEDKYDVADFIDVAAWVILFRVFIDYEFESYYSMIIPGTVSCIIILAILFLTHKRIENSTRNRWWIYTSLIFNVCLYSYAGTYAANCTYDYSKPAVYEAEVVNKRISKGRRSTSYQVEVTPWGHHHDTEEITVSRIQYNKIEVGEKVKIDLKEGLFGIPWYYLEKK